MADFSLCIIKFLEQLDKYLFFQPLFQKLNYAIDNENKRNYNVA